MQFLCLQITLTWCILSNFRKLIMRPKRLFSHNLHLYTWNVIVSQNPRFTLTIRKKKSTSTLTVSCIITNRNFHVTDMCKEMWAPPSEFVSSSIPSWQIITAHAQPFRGARDLAFCLKVPLDSLLLWASSEGSGETARMRKLAWTFTARIGYKYQIRLTRSMSSYHTRGCKTKCLKYIHNNANQHLLLQIM